MSSKPDEISTAKWVEIAAWGALGALVTAILAYGLWITLGTEREPDDLRRLRQVNRVLELLGIQGGDTRSGQLQRDAAQLTQARQLIDRLERELDAQPSIPGRAQVFYLRGIERLAAQDDAGAQAALQQAQQLDPEAISINLALGTVHFRRADYDWAEQAFRRVLARDPDNRAGLNNLGQTLYVLGKRDEALSLYGRLSAMEAADREAAAQKSAESAPSEAGSLSLQPGAQ